MASALEPPHRTDHAQTPRHASITAIALGGIYIVIATLAAGLGFTLYEKLGGSLERADAGSPVGATGAVFGALLSYVGAALAVAGVGGIVVGALIVLLAVLSRRGVIGATYTLATLFTMSGLAKVVGAFGSHSNGIPLVLWAAIDFAIAVALVREHRQAQMQALPVSR